MLADFLASLCLNMPMFFTTGFPGMGGGPGAIHATFGILPWKPLLATISLWYAVPLLVSVSLVCAATRQEEMGFILRHAMRFAAWVAIFMGGVVVILTLLGWMA